MDRCLFCFSAYTIPQRYDLKKFALCAHNSDIEFARMFKEMAEKNSCEQHKKEFWEIYQQLVNNEVKVQESIDKAIEQK